MSSVTEVHSPPQTVGLPLVAEPWQSATSPVAARLRDYLELTKPRIAVMVLVTVAVGYLLGQQGSWQSATLWHAWLGIALVAAGSSAINQWIERHTDARMRRTMSRPLPAGRLLPWEVFAFGIITAILGCAYLTWQVNGLTALLTGLTFVLYGFIYTPLKRWTSLCTAIGAIPGALPPVLGWTAAGQPLDATAFALFAVLFVWQFPHFLAIAWLYREDYVEAGLRMLPGGLPAPRVTGLMATVYALGLIPVSLLPSALGIAGTWYSVTAVVLGLAYVAAAIGFAHHETRGTARRLLLTSLVYLPTLLLVLACDHLRGLSGG